MPHTELEALEAGLREAARLTCSLCREGVPIEPHQLCREVFYHRWIASPGAKELTFLGCSATRIWERLAELGAA